MRRLWRGEVIFNHDGPIGKYQVLFLDPTSTRTSRWLSSRSARTLSHWAAGCSTT